MGGAFHRLPRVEDERGTTIGDFAEHSALI